MRLSKLESLLARLGEPEFRPATLGGAIVQRRVGEILVHREPGREALPEIELSPGEAAVWDLRFRVAADPELATPVTVAPLGRTGFAKLRQQLERDPKIPARAAATLPAFWQEGTLLAVPALAPCRGLRQLGPTRLGSAVVNSSGSATWRLVCGL